VAVGEGDDVECRIAPAVSAEDVEAVRELFTEYYAWLGEVVCSQRLSEEIASLPGPYAAPKGRLLLARDASERAVGVIGVRPHHADVCEMKRLYVRPEARDRGLGRRLAQEAIAAAREMGYSLVLLTTLPDSMQVALGMYERLGFRPTAPFLDHSHFAADVAMAFLELPLD
jgi:putative acetyltransferase